MKQRNYTEIFSKLENSKIAGIGAAADMMWLAIGDPVDYTNPKGEIMGKNQYGIHLQCPWQLTLHNQILVANYDFYVTDENGFTYFEKFTSQNYFSNNHHMIERVTMNQFGDIVVSCNNDLTLKVFINTTKNKKVCHERKTQYQRIYQ